MVVDLRLGLFNFVSNMLLYLSSPEAVILSTPTSMLVVSNWPTLTVRIAAQLKTVKTLITYCIRSLFVVSCGLC